MSTDVHSYISRFVTLTADEQQLLMRHLQIMTCSPRQVLTGLGEMEQHVYFVQKGLVRKYFLRGEEEITIQLSTEGDLVSSSVSFLSGVPSDFIVETMEPSVLVFITRSALDYLFSSSNNFEKMGRLITLEWMLTKEKADISRMVMTPKERFMAFCREKPGLLNRVPQKYLASLLDIEPETFSRYKKLVATSPEKLI